MTWNSATEFFAMGGYGLYVWGSFTAAIAAAILEPLLLRQRRKTALAQLQSALELQQDGSDENQA